MTFLWSGRNDGKHQDGAARAVQKNLMAACVSGTPINDRLLHVRFKYTAGSLSAALRAAQRADI